MRNVNTSANTFGLDDFISFPPIPAKHVESTIDPGEKRETSVQQTIPTGISILESEQAELYADSPRLGAFLILAGS
jgi:hypothetical protein